MALTDLARTLTQRKADEMDMELYRLYRQAEDFGWPNVCRHIKAARSNVRMMMHPKDREATEG